MQSSREVRGGAGAEPGGGGASTAPRTVCKALFKALRPRHCAQGTAPKALRPRHRAQNAAPKALRKALRKALHKALRKALHPIHSARYLFLFMICCLFFLLGRKMEKPNLSENKSKNTG